MIEESARSVLETDYGLFEIVVFQEASGKEHVALLKEWEDTIPLVRVHSKCATGDIFTSVYCDCHDQLHSALELIQEEGGVLVYLEQEGRGLGLGHKIRAYELQRQGMDTVEADEKLGEGIDVRHFDLASAMLKSLGVEELQLLTNNPQKVEELEATGLTVQRREHIVPARSERGRKYQETKRQKLGHLFSAEDK